MTTIKERKKADSNSNFKALNGTESLVRGTTNQHKKFGTANILGLKNWIWSYFPFFVVKNVFDKILMKKSPIVLPLPFLPEF